MGALPANLSIGRMIRVLALLCLAVLSMGEPEAEAKAVADPKADPYLLYRSYYGLGHHYYGGYPYYGYYGKRSADAEPAPAADAKAEADPWYGYYGHGYGLGYYGRYYGGHYGYPYYGYYGKRSADAKAAPYLVYSHYGLGGYYGGYYGGYPYYGYYGKRSADAEPSPAPTADAKADPWYGYHGGLAHYGYGYPYYGYGHGYGYYWGK